MSLKDTVILTGKVSKDEFTQNIIHHSHVGQENYHDFKDWLIFLPGTEQVKPLTVLDIPSPYEHKVMTWVKDDERATLAVHMYSEKELVRVIVINIYNASVEYSWSKDVVVSINVHGNNLLNYKDSYWVGEVALMLSLIGARAIADAINTSNIDFVTECCACRSVDDE